MKANLKSFLSRFFHDQRGQMLPTMAAFLVATVATAALSIDLGRCYYGYRELVASANAAALAGAEVLPNSGATTAATNFSSLSGDNNANANMANVTMVTGYPKVECLTTLSNEGMSCVAPGNGNAVQVQEQMVINLFFAPVFGKKTLTLTATATAAMAGAITSPYNVAIIVDATKSMNDTDSDSQCNATRISCALNGVRILLGELYPCTAQLATCGTATNNANVGTAPGIFPGGANVANSVDRVSLFSFPNVSLGTVADDWNCGSSSPSNMGYTFPSATATSYAPTGSSTATYQIMGYDSDSRLSDTTNSLNTASDAVIAAGGKSSCNAMVAVGGEGTYYAGAIYAAQASLVAEKANNPGSQNIMIILSDGDASASSGDMPTASTTSGVYPSTKNQCAQAVTAAHAAANAGTRVISVAYGAESSGCSTDTSSYTPCVTMQDMASSSRDFYSDYTATGGTSGCVSASQPTTNLNQIFTDIATSLSVPRLIPNGTT